jgi:murein DD-endopeptidase MepM/ murein hydrolase activator NlpD
MRQPFPGFLPVPVDGVRIGDLRDSYGDPRSGGRWHQGIDILAPRHTPVRSTTEGIVLRKARLKLGGITVTVVGPGGSRHYYAHLERWAKVKEGKKVKPGDILGYVGNSGNARNSPTHLHYSVSLPSRQPVNPYPLLKRGPGPFS